MKLSKAVLILLLIINIVVTYVFYAYQTDNLEQKKLGIITNFINKIDTTVKSAIQPVSIFEKFLLTKPENISKENFYNFAQSLYNPETYIGLFFAPSGIIEASYPDKDNPELLDRNLFLLPDTREFATLAKEKDIITISGPQKIFDESAQTIMIYNPIFYERDGQKLFWGLISVALQSPEFLKFADIEDLETLGYEFSIRTVENGYTNIVRQSTAFENHKSPFHDFQINNQAWQVSLYETQSEKYILQYSIWFLGFLLAVSILIYLALKYLEQRNQKYKEQLTVDKLTGAYNRKFLDILKFQSEYHIFYIDLDRFKPVNDTYGHDVGDQLLINYVKRLKRKVKSDTHIIRMGGDEFLVLINNALVDKQVTSISTRLQKSSESPFYIDTHTINVGASIGHAAYPKDGKDFNELLENADKKMYAIKNAKKNQV